MSKMTELMTVLSSGGAVVLPTETVYGLFARALDEVAVDYVYQLKKRPQDKAMNLNVSCLEEIQRFSIAQPAYLERLVSHFMPGPLTIILKASPQVPKWVNAGLDTVGFRIPHHPVTLALIKAVGPLIGPSANISGTSSGVIFKDIMAQFHGKVTGFKDDEFLTGLDSTILDLSGQKASLLRQGAITKNDLLAIVPELNFE